MKKSFLLLLFLSFIAFGTTNAQMCNSKCSNSNCAQFVDKNNDGICDNKQNCKRTCKQKSCGKNFVDKNNDGICDNASQNKGNCCKKGRKNRCQEKCKKG